MKRKLNNEERLLCLKQLQRKEEDKEWLEYTLKIREYDLAEGLKVKFTRLRRNAEKERAAWKAELNETNSIIKVLKDQLKNGVKIKEKKNGN